jgi:outer membrane receptor for ferrienterochelin and colicins
MRNFFFILSLFFMMSGWGQNCRIQFVDSENRSPIPGLMISLRMDENQRGIQKMTNNDGLISLESSFQGQTFWFKTKGMGYKEKEGKIDSLRCEEILVISLKTLDLMKSEVVVTAAHQSQSVDQSVQIVRVIDAAKIEAMGAVSLVEALGNELNIQMARDNVLGTGISIQGLAGQNVKILIDGVPILGRLDGNIDISQINMAQVERIEIIEGPMSVNFGSDALGGTINIIMKRDAQNGWRLNSKFFYESFGNYNAQMATSLRKNNHSIGLDFARYFFDGWSPNHEFLAVPKITVADTNRTHLWNPKEQYFGSMYYRFDNRKFVSTTSFNGYYEHILNRGRPVLPYFLTAFDDTYQTHRYSLTNETSWFAAKSWKFSSVTGLSGFQRQKNTYFIDLTELNPSLVAQNSMHDTTQFYQILNRTNAIRFTENGKMSYEMGYEFSSETMLGKRILNTQQNMWYADFFSTMEWSPNKNFSMKPGVRYGYNSTYRSLPVASFQTRYSWKKWVAKATIGTGFRAPSIKELYFEFIDINHNIVGNPNLTAENSWNTQLLLNTKIRIKNSAVRLEWKGFYNRISNQIQLANVLGTTEYTYFNLANVLTTGGSFSAGYSWGTLQIKAGMGATAYNQSTSTLSQNEFLHYLEWNGSASYRFEKQKASVNLFYRSTGKQPFFYTTTDGNLERGYMDSFHFLDLTLMKSSKNNQFDFSLGLRNMLNVRSVPIVGAMNSGAHSSGGTQFNVARGMSVFGSISYQFHKTAKQHD